MVEQEWARLKSTALLCAHMDAANLSFRDMADRLPVSKSTVHDLSTGRKPVVKAEVAERIAEVLQVPFPVLFAPAPSTKRGRPSKTAA